MDLTITGLAAELELVREEARRSEVRHIERAEAISRRVDELEKQIALGRAEVHMLGGEITALRKDIADLRDAIKEVGELAREAKQAASDGAAEQHSRDRAVENHINQVAMSMTASVASLRAEMLREVKSGRENDERQNIELASQSEILREMRDTQRAHDTLERMRMWARVGTIVGTMALMGVCLALRLDEKIVLGIPGAIGVLAYQLLTVRSAKRVGDSVRPPALNP